jgi:plasmid maintenance system antidote protein VapI
VNKGAEALQRFFQSQEQVAPALGIKPSMLSLLLSGKRKPSIEVAAAIERMFGVPCRLWVEDGDGDA